MGYIQLDQNSHFKSSPTYLGKDTNIYPAENMDPQIRTFSGKDLLEKNLQILAIELLAYWMGTIRRCHVGDSGY